MAFVTGGNVQAGRGLYVVRRADSELLELCLTGRFAVVLHSRQVGKSSLIAHASSTLRQRGVRTAVIDLTNMGTKQFTAEQWYLAVLDAICTRLGIARELDFVAWWDEHARLTHVYRLVSFCSGPLLERVKERIVIFLDEIDTTLELDFTDDFFAAVRDLYQMRNQMPELERLSFVVAGASTPDDLMRDASRTPFNIGVRVNIEDFTLAECRQFAEGFGSNGDGAQAAIERIYHFTHGHPYLTQRLCAYLVEDVEGEPLSAQAVDEVVENRFFGREGSEDRNLDYVREMLTVRADKIVGPGEVLRFYREIVRGARVKEDPQSNIQAHLRLAGVVVLRDGYLRVRNRIYERVFGRRWLREQLPFDWQTAGKAAVVVLGVVLLVAGYYFGYKAPRERARAERENLVRSSIDVLSKTANEREAAAQYATLKQEPVEIVRSSAPATLGPARSPADALYRAFWLRRAAALEQRGKAESNHDSQFLWSALAAIKRGEAIPPELVREFDARYQDALPVVGGHRGKLSAAALSTNGERLATGGEDGVIRIWDYRAGAENPGTWLSRRSVEFQLAAVHYRPDFIRFEVSQRTPDALVAVSWSGLVLFQDLGDANAKAATYFTQPRDSEVRVQGIRSYSPTAASLAPAGDRVVVAGGALQELRLPGLVPGISVEIPRDDKIWSVDFAPDGARLATSSLRGYAELRGKGLSSIKQLPDDRGGVLSVRFSADGHWLLTAGASGTATLWNLDRGTADARLDHEGANVSHAEFCCQKLADGHCAQDANDGAFEIVTVADDKGNSLVRRWTVPVEGATRLAPSLSRTYPGLTSAISDDCRFVVTLGGEVSGAAIEGAVVRSLVPSAKKSDAASETPLDTFERWEITLQRVVKEAVTAGDVDSIANLEPDKPLATPAAPPAAVLHD